MRMMGLAGMKSPPEGEEDLSEASRCIMRHVHQRLYGRQRAARGCGLSMTAHRAG